MGRVICHQNNKKNTMAMAAFACSCAMDFFCRRVEFRLCLLAALLLVGAAVPARAVAQDQAAPFKIAAASGVASGDSVHGTGTITVIYPDIGEPYRSVFAQIIDGIQDRAGGRVIANVAVGPKLDVGALNDSLRRQDARVVIALGREGMKVASALDNNIGIVAGGVLAAPAQDTRSLQVNSLSPDPALLFSHLKGMVPRVRRVFAVYDPRQSAWMMHLAKEAARAQGLELVVYEVHDLRSAMHAYQEIFNTVDSRRDALWLPQDATSVEDSSVLPLVLQESWNRNLAVFSSSFAYVRRGLLFSLYPDNVELGRQLASSALGFLASSKKEMPGMLPLRAVQMAVNLRTAKHLGIDLDRQHDVGMAFPRQ